MAPVVPCGPAGPVAPVAPCGPAGPCGPVAPLAPTAPTGPTTAQVALVSPATQLEIELTMRTSPVVGLIHAETELETGEAIAAIPARSEKTTAPAHEGKINVTFILGHFLLDRSSATFMPI